jgi:hypothetical protein
MVILKQALRKDRNGPVASILISSTPVNARPQSIAAE